MTQEHPGLVSELPARTSPQPSKTGPPERPCHLTAGLGLARPGSASLRGFVFRDISLVVLKLASCGNSTAAFSEHHTSQSSPLLLLRAGLPAPCGSFKKTLPRCFAWAASLRPIGQKQALLVACSFLPNSILGF